MANDLPILKGYNQQQASKIRLAYIRFLNTATPTELRVSRLDFGVHINNLEKQLKRRISCSYKMVLEDMFYDTYLTPEVINDVHEYIVKQECISLGLNAIDQMLNTYDWIIIKSRVQSFELLFRCLFYDFKNSAQVKKYLKEIPHICLIEKTNTMY